MKIPLVLLRMTAYHIVVASPEPWMRCHGRSGMSSPGAMAPATLSCFCVAT